MKKDKRMKEWIGSSELVKNAITVLSSQTSSSSSSSSTTNAQTVSIEEKEGLIQLLILLIREGIPFDDEAELLRIASTIEEEADEKCEEVKEEEEREQWERLEDGATKLIKTLKKKKGEKSTMSGIEKGNKAELEEEKKKRQEVEKEAKEKEKDTKAKLDAITRERDELKTKLQQKEEEERKRYSPITTLSNVRVYFPKTDGIKNEGNTIIHHGAEGYRNAVIGDAMTEVCFNCYSWDDYCLLYLIGNLSHVCFSLLCLTYLLPSCRKWRLITKNGLSSLSRLL